MIVKHSADETPKPMPVGLRLARVISIGNGTVDVCPIGSSVVLHDIPVTSATTMEVGNVVNLQMMDNKRFAFASQNAVVSGESVAGNVTIQNGDVIIAGEGGTGTGTITGVSAGTGLIGGGNAGIVTLSIGPSVATSSWAVNAGSGLTGGGNLSSSGITLSVGSDVVRTSRAISAGDGLSGGGDLSANRTLAVNNTVVRTSRTIYSGNGLSGGGDLSDNRTLSVKPSTEGSAIAVDASGVFLASSLAGDGLSMISQVLNVEPGNGIKIDSDKVAVNLATASGLNTANGLAVNTSGAGTGLSLVGNVLSVNVANGIEISGNNVGLKTGSVTGLYLNGDVLSAKPGIGVAVDGVDNTLYVKSAATVNGITSGITVNTNGVSVDSSVARDTWQVNPASEGGLSGGGNLSAITPPVFSIATGTNTGLLLNGGLLKLDTSVAGDGLAMGTDRIIAVELSAASGLELTGTSPNKTLQINNSVAGFGLVINSNTKVLSVASDTTTLNVSENSVDVNTGYAFPWTNNHTWSTLASIASSGAMSGFAGSGWLVRNSGSLGLMDIDELSVRGRMRVYELLVQQIRATNGSIFVSSSAKVASVIGSGPYTITIDAKGTDFCPFAEGDLLRAQRVNLGGVSSSSPDIVWQSDLRVDSISGLSFTATLVSGNAPAAGMEYVRLGNDTTTTRQSSVYMTADDSFAPYIDVVSGVASFADWGTKIRTRIGKLDGVTASVVGSTAGSNEFGVWAGTGTGVGSRYIRISDKIVELRNVPIELYGNNSNVQMRLTGGDSNNQPTFAMGITIPTSSTTPDSNGVWIGQETAGGAYKFRVGQITSGSLAAGILWDGSALTVTGAINVVSGNAAKTDFSNVSAGYAASSSPGGDASNTLAVGGTQASTVLQATTRANAAIGALNQIVTRVIPASAAAPTGSGLYLGSDFMGFYNGSNWKTYMDNSGNFSISGSSGTQGLTWSATNNTLSIDGAITARSGSIAGTLAIGAGGAIQQGTGTFNTDFTGISVDQENSRGRIRFFDTNSVRAVFGNVAGNYDYAAGTPVYGIAVGSSAATWISADPTNGMRVMNSTTERFRVTSVGVVTIGNQASSGASARPYISVDDTNGFQVIRNSITRFSIDASGNLNINNSAGANVISMDTSGAAKFANTVTVGTQIGIVPGSASSPYIAIGDTTSYPTTPLASGNGIWMGSSGNKATLRIGSSSGTAVTSGIYWDGSTLSVTGNITVNGGNAAKTDLSNLSVGYAASSTAGGAATNALAVGGTAAATILQATTRANNAIGANNEIVTRVVPASSASPSGDGLYLGSDNMGFYKSNYWRTFMSSTGDFVFRGAPSTTTPVPGLVWSSSAGTLSGGTYAAATSGYGGFSTQWYAGSDGKFYAGGGNAVLDSTGVYIIPKYFASSGAAGRPGTSTPVAQNVNNYLTNAQGFTFQSQDGGRYGIYGWKDDGSTPKRYGMEISAWGINNGYKGTIIIQGTNVFLRTEDNVNGYVSAETPFWAYDMYVDYFHKRTGTGDISSDTGINVTGSLTASVGLNVGTSGATAGQIKATTGTFSGAVSGTTGTFSSTLSATGNLAINTNKFTVAGTTGNTVIAGTLTQTGAATLSSTLSVAGASTLTGALSVSGELESNFSSGWVVPTLTAPWANLAGGYTSFSYKRVGDFVFLRGVITRSASTSLTPFTLPADFKPLARQIFVVTGAPLGQTTESFYRVDILTTGEIRFVSIGTTAIYSYLSFGNIVFSVV